MAYHRDEIQKERGAIYRHPFTLYADAYRHDDLDGNNIGRVGGWLIGQYNLEKDENQKVVLHRVITDLQRVIEAEKQTSHILKTRTEQQPGWSVKRQPVLVAGFSAAPDEEKVALVQQFLAERVRPYVLGTGHDAIQPVVEAANQEPFDPPHPVAARDTVSTYIDERTAEILATIHASFADAKRKRGDAFTNPSGEEMARRYLVPPADVLETPGLDPLLLATARGHDLSDQEITRIQLALVQYQVASREFHFFSDPRNNTSNSSEIVAYTKGQEQAMQEAELALQSLYATHYDVFSTTNAKLAALPVLDQEVQGAPVVTNDLTRLLEAMSNPIAARRYELSEKLEMVGPEIAAIYTDYFTDTGEPKNYHPKMSDASLALMHNVQEAVWNDGPYRDQYHGNAIRLNRELHELNTDPETIERISERVALHAAAFRFRVEMAGFDKKPEAAVSMTAAAGDPFDDEPETAAAVPVKKSRLKSFINFALPVAASVAAGLALRTKFAMVAAAVTAPLGLGAAGVVAGAAVTGMAAGALANAVLQVVKTKFTKTQNRFSKRELLMSTALGAAGGVLGAYLPDMVQSVVDKAREWGFLAKPSVPVAPVSALAPPTVVASVPAVVPVPDAAVVPEPNSVIPADVLGALPERVQGFAQSGNVRDQLKLYKEAAYALSQQQGFSPESVKGQMDMLRQAVGLINDNPELRRTVAGQQVLRDTKWLAKLALQMRPMP